MTMMKKGYERLRRSQNSTGLIAGVMGRLADTETYTEASTIMQVIFTVIIKSNLLPDLERDMCVWK